jgi:hypothetical protein
MYSNVDIKTLRTRHCIRGAIYRSSGNFSITLSNQENSYLAVSSMPEAVASLASIIRAVLLALKRAPKMNYMHTHTHTHTRTFVFIIFKSESLGENI